MRRIRYQVACSLDGFIAGPGGDCDWITHDPDVDWIRALRDEEGLDIWLYGGGELFSALLGMDLVDSVEPAIIPILLGGGVPFLPSPSVRRGLTLTGHRIYGSGIVLLEYSVTASGA
jgi:dihydrofolate reductase